MVLPLFLKWHPEEAFPIFLHAFSETTWPVKQGRNVSDAQFLDKGDEKNLAGNYLHISQP